MIDGLRFEIKSDELKTHLNKQAILNKDFVATQRGTLDSLGDAQGAVPQRRAVSGTLEMAQSRQVSFSWLSNHVIPNETYRISLAEAAQIDLVFGLTGTDEGVSGAYPFVRQAGTDQRVTA